ncbi:hypothetical protein Trydic_g21585 [Trypoxylus dichotomus]
MVLKYIYVKFSLLQGTPLVQQRQISQTLNNSTGSVLIGIECGRVLRKSSGRKRTLNQAHGDKSVSGQRIPGEQKQDGEKRGEPKVAEIEKDIHIRART